MTKTSSLLLHAIQSSCYWWILQKTISNQYLKIQTKDLRKKENLSLFMNSLSKKLDKKLESEKTQVCAHKPRLKMPFKNSISGIYITVEQIHGLQAVFKDKVYSK
jgi:hypothetical protein